METRPVEGEKREKRGGQGREEKEERRGRRKIEIERKRERIHVAMPRGHVKSLEEALLPERILAGSLSLQVLW